MDLEGPLKNPHYGPVFPDSLLKNPNYTHTTPGVRYSNKAPQYETTIGHAPSPGEESTTGHAPFSREKVEYEEVGEGQVVVYNIPVHNKAKNTD